MFKKIVLTLAVVALIVGVSQAQQEPAGPKVLIPKDNCPQIESGPYFIMWKQCDSIQDQEMKVEICCDKDNTGGDGKKIAEMTQNMVEGPRQGCFMWKPKLNETEPGKYYIYIVTYSPDDPARKQTAYSTGQIEVKEPAPKPTPEAGCDIVVDGVVDLAKTEPVCWMLRADAENVGGETVEKIYGIVNACTTPLAVGDRLRIHAKTETQTGDCIPDNAEAKLKIMKQEKLVDGKWFHSADTDRDLKVGDFEMLRYIKKWGKVEDAVSDDEVLAAINMWAHQYKYGYVPDGKGTFESGMPDTPEKP